MSKINIPRAVDNIKANVTVYSAIIEIIVNAIQAIEQKDSSTGKINVKFHRAEQIKFDEDSNHDVESIEITDDGIGFTDENRDSFDTLYSDLKIAMGGKGFGRFICLKYFKEIKIISHYFDGTKYQKRTFKMGNKEDIITDEIVTEAATNNSGTTVHLRYLRSPLQEKKLSTIARNIFEKLLPYFTTEEYSCPSIALEEADGSESIILNNYLNDPKATIKEIKDITNSFAIDDPDGEVFKIRIFTFYSPKNQKSKICLIGHKREVTESALSSYVPEFIDEFLDPDYGDNGQEKNFILKAYVFGKYLDDNVSLERAGFDFREGEIDRELIETKASQIVKDCFEKEYFSRFEKKRNRIREYVNKDAPWFKNLVDDVEIADFPFNPKIEEIEALLNQTKWNKEREIKADVQKLIDQSGPLPEDDTVENIVEKISETNKVDLIKYVTNRKMLLALFEKSLLLTEDDKYPTEKAIHQIIFPTRTTVDDVKYEDHNLWIIDERLNFTEFLSSDTPLNKKRDKRPDILIFNNRVAYRESNEYSNPVTIFEFKRPGRDDFATDDSKEDPVKQVLNYVKAIRDGKFTTKDGIVIQISGNTTFYGYIICHLNKKVADWLVFQNFNMMPDGRGWFYWHNSLNTYIEVLAWDKVLKDAKQRSKIFFHKLGV